MFTGIIKNLGTVKSFEKSNNIAKISVSVPGAFLGAVLGDSVAINGTCLTIIESDNDYAVFELGPETLIKTSFKDIKENDIVNVEFPLRLVDKLGGHFVQGHVDGVAKVINVTKTGEAFSLEIELPKELHDQIIPHGSVSVNGVSLTIANKNKNSISIMIMSYTMDNTNFSKLKPGDLVNIEIDMLAKYVAEQVNRIK